MKFLFDLLPVIVFFAGYASGRTIPALGLTQPILLATALAMVVSAAQIGWLHLRGRKVDTLQWISFVLILVMGGATVVLHNAVFVKLKTTLLSGAMAMAMVISRYGLQKQPLQLLLGKELQLAPALWDKLMWAWVVFFAVQGGGNLYVAFHCTEAVWVKYHLYSLIGLPIAFAIIQGVWIARHLPDAEARNEKS